MKKEFKIKLSEWIASQKNLPLEIDGKIVDQTERAVKVEYITTATVWLPRRQIVIVEKQGE